MEAFFEYGHAEVTYKKHTYREAKYKLSTVAKGMGVSKVGLMQMLRSRGIVVHRNDHVLTAAQVSIIAKAYVYAFKRQFFQTVKGVRYDYYDYILEPYMSFMRINPLEPENPKYWALDDELIEDRFYFLINCTELNERRVFGSYAAILRRMLRVVKVYTSNTVNLLHSIIPPKLFFTYSDEEDSATAAFNKWGFAVAGNK